MTSTPSRRVLLKAATGATLLGGRARSDRRRAEPRALPGLSPNATQATITDKMTWWDTTSTASPAVTRLLNTVIHA